MKLDVKQYRIHVSGNTAVAIERAERSSFYGIFGNGSASAAGYMAAREAVNEYFENNGLSFAWYYITAAKEEPTDNSWPEYTLTVTTA